MMTRQAPRWPLALLAAASHLASAQQAPSTETVMPVVKATGSAERSARDNLQATTTRIGKGEQELRDIPQSVTVVTEKLIDDRNLDTLKEALKNTAGISLLAAEGGEEDIRLRGFALQGTGDVFVDGMRDPAFYERDTFFYDRLEVLRGSASMLFGRGSTGGAVNQVGKQAFLMTQHQVDLTLGSHAYKRLVGDFNLRLGESSGLRLGAMATEADDNGAGTPLSKQGLALNWRWGMGERHEWSVTAYVLRNRNGMNYGLPWIRPTPTADVSQTTVLPLDPATSYAMASDRNDGSAQTLTLQHKLRLDRDHQISTQLRRGVYERDQRASTVRLGAAALQPGGVAASLATFSPATVLTRGAPLKIQDLDLWLAQSDYNGRFQALGLRHELQAGIDLAHENKNVAAARTVAQGGVLPAKPNTTIGSPNDGAWVDEASRVLRSANDYKSNAVGVYAQDLVQLATDWKLLLGLRYDMLRGVYDNRTLPQNAPAPETQAQYRMKVSEWSKRLGLLWQPTPLSSFHFSAATSFNTSGDAYSLSAANVDIPPEQSINLELGAKLDSEDGKLSARFAVFRATKLHERNTDPLVNLVTLSGKRHVAGFEVDLAGRLTPTIETYLSYMWLPVANIDKGVAGSEGQGTRPSLTPEHTASLWATWQATPAWRFGAGLNARSSQTPNRNPGWSAAGFVTGELMAEWVALRDRLTLKLNVSNVTNKLYADALYSGHYVPGPGRLVQLTASTRF